MRDSPNASVAGKRASRAMVSEFDLCSVPAAVNPVFYVDDWAIVGQNSPPTVPPFRDLSSIKADVLQGSWDPRVPLESRLALIRHECEVSPSPQPREFNDATVTADSLSVIQHVGSGGCMASWLARRQASRSSLRMRPELLRVALAKYPRLPALLKVAYGVVMFLDPAFVPVPYPRFSAKYATDPARSLVNARLARDAAKGHYVLLNSAAANVVRHHTRGHIHDNPLSWVPKDGSALGRLTTNCSYGVAGGYADSLNHRTLTERVAAVHGDPTVHTVHDLARSVHAASTVAGPGSAIAVADASGAFTWMDLHPSSALMLTSGVLDSAVDMAIPLSGNFGYTTTPTWWREVADAITWVVRNAPIGWYLRWMRTRAVRDAVILPEHGPRRPLHNDSVHDLLQSLLAAMALVVCPMDRAAPVVNLSKVRPGATATVYVGWVVDARAQCVRLSWRGMRKLLRALFVTIPPLAKDCSIDALRSVIGVLVHYGALWPALGCLLNQFGIASSASRQDSAAGDVRSPRAFLLAMR